MSTRYFSYIESPLGQLFVWSDGRFVTGLRTAHHRRVHGPDARWIEASEPFAELREQLAEYFAGERMEFDVPLKLAGTTFQQRVWRELVQIPFGSTIAYAELARRIGQPTASRAVGN